MNNKYIEALEKIKEKLQIHPIPSTNDQLCYEIWECIDIATQALAPQEDEVICISSQKVDGLDKLRKCINKDMGLTTWCNGLEENCDYKQLHSQQKTFTVEEIEEIINKILSKSNAGRIIARTLLAEFEMAVK